MPFKNLPLYNSRIIDNYIKLIRRDYRNVNIESLLNYAGMEEYEVADQGHWFTQQQINRFHEKSVELTGNDGLAREAGRFAASPEAIGAMRQYVLGMLGPAKVYESISKTAANFTLSSTYQSTRLAPSRYEITVFPKTGVEEQPFQCENRIGFFESIVMMFSHAYPDIFHPECIFRGGEKCRYIISWKSTFSGRICLLRNFIFLITALSSPLLLLIFQNTSVANFSLICLAILSVLFVLNFASHRAEIKQLNRSIDHLKHSSEKLLDQINTNYNNSTMTNEIGQAIGNEIDVNIILKRISEIVQNRLDFDRGMILLIDTDKNQLVYKQGFGYSELELDLLEKIHFSTQNQSGKGIFIASLRQRSPFLVNSIKDIENELSSKSLEFARNIGTHAFICCPIISGNEAIGILAVDNKVSKRRLVQSDMSLLMGIANVLGMSIQNAQLIQAKEEQFQSLLQVLAASTDARDFLTAGHSQKVTEYSAGICKELGIPHEYCEVIRVAALLHDYGKIGVPDAILKKKGRLSLQEYEIVKTHAEKTREILQQINFEGSYREVPNIAGAHHEKIDGSGYPLGLTGDEIPLGAKIIAVADFFEAITSKRHYREPMELSKAFRIMREGIGTHFEAKIVEAFIRYISNSHPEAHDDEIDPGATKDRRGRVPLCTEVSISHGPRSFRATSADLSSNGIYIATDEQLVPETVIELSFVLPTIGSSNLIQTAGQVVWMNSHKNRLKPHFPAGYGIKFMSIKASAAEWIEDFIDGVGDEQLQLEMNI